jgi:hypothetical protein
VGTSFLFPNTKECVMSKFNQKGADPFGRAGAGSSPITVTDRRASARTFEGAPSFARSGRGQLFLTCTAGFIAEDKFYEKGDATVTRVRELTATIATEAAPRRKLAGAFTGKAVDTNTGTVTADESDTGLSWLLPFVTWLRRNGNMRTAPIVVACEAVHARLTANIHGGNRELIRAALYRADEPGELIAYWRSRFGRAIPSCVKRGIGDTLPDLYTEYSALKYDTNAHGVRFGDVLDITHWTHGAHGNDEDADARNALHTWLLDRRHNRPDAISNASNFLPMVVARAQLETVPVADRRALVGSEILNTWMRGAGVTWEWLSGWLSDGEGMDAAAWEAVIPSMGYMALLRNLANFDKAGVSDRVAAEVAARLADPAQVARCKQFPFRFLSAFRQVPSLRWGHALDKALTLSTANIPALDGKTLVLVDTSGSMDAPMSGKSKVSCVDAAALFGTALAFRNQGNVDLAGWASGTYTHTITPGASLMGEVQLFTNRAGSVGHGTDLAQALAKTFRRGEHSRVFVFSDMQLMASGWYGGVDAVNRYVPAEVPVYSFNLVGYAGAMTAGTNRHELGGLTDATFRLVPVIEAAQSGQWPWEMAA